MFLDILNQLIDGGQIGEIAKKALADPIFLLDFLRDFFEEFLLAVDQDNS